MYINFFVILIYELLYKALSLPKNLDGALPEDRPGFSGVGKGGSCPGGGKEFVRFLPHTQCILDKDAHNLKETYCFVIPII